MANVVTVSNQVTAATLQYAPLAMAGVLAAEQSTAAGADKKQAVLNGVLAGAKVGEQNANANVAAVSGLIDLFVSIFNALGVFKHTPAPSAS